MKKGMLAACVVFVFSGASAVHADTEFSLGLGMAWESLTELGLSASMPINWGYTSAEIETVTRRVTDYEIMMHGWRPGYVTEKVKNMKPFDFDIMGDLTLGFPFSQAGALFNLYLWTPFTPGAIGVGIGVGAGYAVGFDIFGDENIFHGPYIKGTIPLVVGDMVYAVNFDYFFFEKQCYQIGGFFKILF